MNQTPPIPRRVLFQNSPVSSKVIDVKVAKG